MEHVVNKLIKKTQTDMTRLVVAFRDYANAPRNLSGMPFLSWHMYLQHESVAVSLN